MKVGRLLSGAVAALLLLLIGVEESRSQPVSTWVDTWPTGTGGIKPILDTLENPQYDPCTEITDSIVTLGYEADTSLGIDSCNWTAWPSGPNCACGGLYPGGPDFYRSTWGVNYDPAYFGWVSDTCDHENPTWTGGGAPQPRHLYDVPCWYETDSTDPNHPELNTGCLTLQFGVTHCQTGKHTEMLQFDFSNYAGACFGDAVRIVNVTDPEDLDTLAFFEKDSTGVPIGNSRFFLDLTGNEIAPAPPCAPRIFKFEICGLWKEGRSPAEHECAAVFEVTFRNTDISTCGVVPFIFGGRCPGLPSIEPIEGDDGPSLSYRMYYDGR